MQRRTNLLTSFHIVVSLFISAVITTTVKADEIVIFGATGSVGSVIVREALNRGHTVIGVSRSPESFSYNEDNFTGVKGDPTDIESIKAITSNADAIINAVGGREAATPEETAMNQSAQAFSEALLSEGKDGPNLVVIGGGMTMLGSVEKMKEKLPPNATEGSPMYALFIGHWVAYQTYLNSNINWTFLAPPMDIIGFRNGDDVRTGEYRTAIGEYVVDTDGKNSISISDLAVAAVDFAENGKFTGEKVTVGY